MEESLKTTLRLTATHLEHLSIKARETINIIPGPPTDELILQMEIVISKLESTLNRIKAETNNYYKMVNQPDADEISRISTLQLEAEDNLCELQVRVIRAQATSKEAAMPVSGKLPQLNLPEYHGDILTWHQFWDQFVSLVDSRRLSDVDKFMYLNSAVKGEAKRLIEGLGTTNKNNANAVNTLKERYGRVELVKDAHYSALSKIKPADISTNSCRNVLSEIETHLRVLSSLGEDDTHSYLRFMILGKFPEEIVYELKKRVQDDSVPEIRKELEKLISAKEDASRFIAQTSESTSGNYTTETLHVSERYNNPRFERRKDNDRFKNNNYGQRNHYASISRNQRLKRKFENNRERTFRTEPSEKRFKITCLFCGAEHNSEKYAWKRGIKEECVKPGNPAPTVEIFTITHFYAPRFYQRWHQQGQQKQTQDNMVTGTNTVEEAIELYNNTKQEFQQMSMNLREWSSNSRDFIEQVPDSCQDRIVKVLGLDWNLELDTLHLRLKEREYPSTKRGVLQCIASIYDPCGYAAPSTLSAKLLLQDLWKLKLKWDNPLKGDEAKRWIDIQKERKNLKDTCVPRCCVENLRQKSYSIHCFTDASTKAYAAVVYIVQGNQRNFVIGKSRLIPIKDQDNLKIPKLELMASLIGHRLIQYVKKSLQGEITKQILWTDSQIVIGWYYSDKLLTPFVSRRIQEMRRNKELEVRYVPTDLNPADVATRPAQPREEMEKWLAGPEFLSKDPAEWPVSPSSNTSLLVGEGLTSTPMEVELNDSEIQDEVGSLNVGSEETTHKDDSSSNGPKEGTHEDIGIVYTKVSEIKKIQAKYFPEELAGKEISVKRNLGLFLDEDGLLRSKGRFQYANWTYDKRYPILLPPKSSYTDNIIMRTHNDNYHVRAAHTLSIIRQNFWISQEKKRVLNVINKCSQCIKQRGGPFKLPPTPALPPERVNYTEPFTFTGIDYLGPILVKTQSGTEKRWICLFTCLAVRVVHLEVVRDLTAEEGLLALRRFIATRNVPTVITSDNATNFKLISEVMTQPYCIEKKIKWRFIPQLAPWFGGFYERLVGMVKVCMKTTLQKHLLTDNQLSTVVKEIEAVVNTRPLTYVFEDVEHTLRPSDFIAMGRTIVTDTRSDGSLPLETQTKSDLVQSWKKGISILEEFKRMFIDRYLLSLRERYSHSPKQPRCTSKLQPSEGQVVQIKSDNKNRQDWKVGKIISLQKGSDIMCRVAHVKVGDKVYTRSLTQLYALEVEDVTSEETAASTMNKEDSKGDLEDSQNVDIDIEVDEMSDMPLNDKGDKENLYGTESISEECTPERVTSPNNVEIDDGSKDDTGVFLRPRQPRDAAVKAREKIRRSLPSLLSAVGSVASNELRDEHQTWQPY